EVPFGAGGRQYLAGVEAEFVEDDGELVHQRNVEIALRILDDLCGLRHLDRGGLVCAGRDDLTIKLIDGFGDVRRRAARHLRDARKSMMLIARIDALGAIADEEVAIEHEARFALDNRNAVVSRASRIYRRLEDHHAAWANYFADRSRSAPQKR